jgi:transcriptional regulator with XRE-family HTH domain
MSVENLSVAERIGEFIGAGRKQQPFFQRFQKTVESANSFVLKTVRTIERITEYTIDVCASIVALRDVLMSSNILLLDKASRGEQEAGAKLAKLWSRQLWPLFAAYQQSQGIEPSEEDFHQEIFIACLHLFSDPKLQYTSPLDAARRVFYRLQQQFSQGYRDNIRQRDPQVRAFRDVLLELPDGYFTHQIAQYLGTTPQTVRRWVRDKTIKAATVEYLSAATGSTRRSYLISEETFRGLEATKTNKQQSMRHRLPNLYTVGEITTACSVSRKTLERWDAAGTVKPQRINGIRYYTNDQVKKIFTLVQKNKQKLYNLANTKDI